MQITDTLDQAARVKAKSYMGDVAWPTVLLGVAVTAGYVATPLLVASGAISLWLALPVMVVLTYAAYTVMHDAAHGCINGSITSLRWLNELMGYMAGQVLMIPQTSHRHEHLAHHRNTNEAETDPDFYIGDITCSPVHALKVGVKAIFNQYAYYLQQRWQVAPRSQNLAFVLETVSAIGLRLAFMAQGFWLEGAVMFLVGGVGGVLLLVYLFAYLVHRPHEAVGRYVDTSTIVIPGWSGKLLTLLWGFQNYHSIHHLFPRVPFYRYRALFNDIEDIMIAKGAPIYHLHRRGLEPVLPMPT